MIVLFGYALLLLLISKTKVDPYLSNEQHDALATQILWFKAAEYCVSKTFQASDLMMTAK